LAFTLPIAMLMMYRRVDSQNRLLVHYLRAMLKAFEFCLPTNATKVPAGPEWLRRSCSVLELLSERTAVCLIDEGGVIKFSRL
jgi:hypothetical protein